jgi:hypothetical protein
MPTKTLTITTAGPCACCGPQCSIILSGGALGSPENPSGSGFFNAFNALNYAAGVPVFFPDLAAAAAYLSSPAVHDCWAAVPSVGNGGIVGAASGSRVGTTYNLTAVGTMPGGTAVQHLPAFVKVFISAANGLDVAYSIVATGVQTGVQSTSILMEAWKDGTLHFFDIVASASNAVAGTMHITVPEDGEYALMFLSDSNFENPGATITANYQFTLDTGKTHCAIGVVYGDEGNPASWQELVCSG